MLGAAESSEKVGAMEKAIFDFTEKRTSAKKTAGEMQAGEEMSRAPGQDTSIKLTGAYKSDAPGNQQFSYHGGHGPGTMMASCTCGQTFKTDEEGNTQAYKVKTDTAAAVGSEFGAYKKSPQSEQFGMGSYKKKAPHEELEQRKYGR
jgi:hypothetical protein